LRSNLVHNVGFQMMVGYRLMRACRLAGRRLPAKVISRAMRHLYGSDIHWDAEFAPGVTIVHGMGMAISGAAKVGRGSILFQHVTLGAGSHPSTHATGAPIVGENVHIGPGATVIGPVVIGAGSKIVAGAVVARSVPPSSLVQSPAPKVVARRAAVAQPATPKDERSHPANDDASAAMVH
jgi:serine O-acetyltransferase